MPPIDGCLSWRSQGFTFPRRELFRKVAAATLPLAVLPKPAIAKPVINHQSLVISHQSPLPGVHKPEFWFGERVSFCWNDEDTEQPYSETGEVIGVVWNPRENYWEYSVTWLSSTVYPSSNYPLYDGNFLTGGELCKL